MDYSVNRIHSAEMPQQQKSIKKRKVGNHPMKNKKIENIGKVAINDILLSDTDIGLYMPIEKMSDNIRKQYEKCEEMFTRKVASKHPEINLKDYVLYRDIALHINIENCKVRYSVSIILWIEDEAGEEIDSEFFDPFDIEINDEDNRYLKKLVLNKLIENLF